MIRPILAANWKMNKTVGESLDFVNRLKQLVTGINDRQVVIAPSFTALYPVGAALKESGIGLAPIRVRCLPGCWQMRAARM
jgi:triosephosphate isomerase